MVETPIIVKEPVVNPGIIQRTNTILEPGKPNFVTSGFKTEKDRVQVQ